MSKEILEKKCAKCKFIKPISEFAKFKWSKSGRVSRCKKCKSEDYRLANPVEIIIDIVGEEWIGVRGYEALYQVSNMGRVKSFHYGVPKLLSASILGRGYYFVALAKSGINKQFLVHRLVATAFIPNPENKPTVNHKNGIKADNCVGNLEWATHSENNLHAYRTGIVKCPPRQKGEGVNSAKLSESQVLEIRQSKGKSSYKLAKEYGVSSPNIQAIKKRKTWKHI